MLWREKTLVPVGMTLPSPPKKTLDFDVTLLLVSVSYVKSQIGVTLQR